MQKENNPQGDWIEQESPQKHRQPFCELDEEALFDMAELFKAFADSTRIKILYLLFTEEHCVGDIASDVASVAAFETGEARALPP